MKPVVDLNTARDRLVSGQRWVIKIGSALLTNDGKGLNRLGIQAWVDQIADLMSQGIEVVLVSSGSVAEGMSRLGWTSRPSEVHQLQAAAAVGQMGLVQAYETAFQQHNKHTAQILLTHADLSNRQRYLNARSTLRTLIAMGVVPIVNENDTVVTDEIRFGDNDTLGALVANLVEADTLVILTDQDGLFTKDPRHNDDAELITEGRASDESFASMAGDGGVLGRGGMITKVKAAAVAARSGADTVIVGGRIDNVLIRLRAKEKIGTLLVADTEPEVARKQWIAGHLQHSGELILDDGAVQALKKGNNSLLPVGVKAVKGIFRRGEVVACLDGKGQIIAKGLINFDHSEAQKLCGKTSAQQQELLGYVGEAELIHIDNLVVL
ncbi:MAG: glutamate 5-kinase [Oleispira sp.]|jgi:glutamate 5-kinase